MTTLHELQWEIQKLLHKLLDDARRDLLHQLAVSCQDEVEEEVPGEESSEVELFDFIVDFLRSKQLRRLEDQGMSRLLVFRDLIDELRSAQEAKNLHHSGDGEEVESVFETEQTVAASASSKTVSSSVVANQVSPHSDKTVGEEPMASLFSSLEPQVSAHHDKTVDEEPMESEFSSLAPQKCNHVVLHSSFSSIEKCTHCLGPFVARKRNGLKCKDCSSIWHKICYEKVQRTDISPYSWDSDELSSADDVSDKEYIPDSVSCSDSSVELSIDDSNNFKRTILDPCFIASLPDCQKSDGAENGLAEGLISEREDCAKKVVQKQMKKSSENKKTVDVQTEERSVEPLTGSEAVESIHSTSISSSIDKKNYCFVCGKPQSKITRHLKVHEKTNAEVAQALAQPKASKLRKKMLGQLRNKGNSAHNKEVYKSGSGLLKIKRRPKLKYNINQYVHCMFCQGLYLRKHFWRHARKCKSKPRTTDETGPKRVLSLASMVDSGLCQQISQGVYKLLLVMKDDEVSVAVRSDFYILQLAQSLFNKHGQDPSKHEYIRQKNS